MIDSHCHLTADQFSEDATEVIQRALNAGVEMIVCIADDLEDSKKCIKLADSNEQIFCTIGVHPHKAATWNKDAEASIKQLITTSNTIKAIGEIGLDYHYDFCDRGVQKNVFIQQIRIANAHNLPVVIHNRDSWQDLWELVEKEQPKKAVLHCCTEPIEHAKLWLNKGYILSFTGICTYKNADAIREVIDYCPLEQMMIETDAPYLAPVPHRGKRNEPAFLPEIVKVIAALKGCTEQEVINKTVQTTTDFFSLS